MKRKLGIGICVLLLAASSFLVIVLASPPPTDSWLPAWIAKVKPSGTSEPKDFLTDAHGTEFVSISEDRVLPMTISEFIGKANRDFRSWTRITGNNTAAWLRETSTGMQMVWASPSGKDVLVSSSQQRRSTWAEKIQRKIRRFFRGKD